MDDIDKRIVSALQEDGSLSIADIADRAGISHTPCWKRVKRLKEAGILEKTVCLVDPKKVGLALTGFVHIRGAHHSREWVANFVDKIAKIPEVVECHRMTGEIDYLLKIVAPSMEGYDAIYHKFVDIGGMQDISVSFSMERMKETTVVPLTFAS